MHHNIQFTIGVVLMELGMNSTTLCLVIFSSLVLNGLSDSLFSNQQKVKTIKMEHSVCDCVDFYKQPAFNHPLLKKYKSKVIPNLVELQGQRVNGFGLKDGGCPVGTVPILRTNWKNSSLDNNQPPGPPQQHCVALVHTNKLDRKFYGASGTLTIYKPLMYYNTQWSSARIKLSNGNDSFEAGWMVNPEAFNDYEAHLYVRFAVGALGGKGCINLQCPGFVQVAKDKPLGVTPDVYSQIGGKQVGWVLSIDRHQDDGNWWLSTVDKAAIGYWPHELFTSLAEFGGKIEWGGEMLNLGPNTDPPPEMGNGVRASYDPLHSACILNATYVDETYKTIINPQDTNKVMDCEGFYTVLDGDYTSKALGRMIYYGSPN